MLDALWLLIIVALDVWAVWTGNSLLISVTMDRLTSNQIIGRDPIRRILYTDPVRTVSARKYVAGDPYRLIDWRTTARAGGLMVRVFEPSTTPLVDIVLNFSVPLSISLDFEPDEAEFMISIGASLSSHAAAQGWAVGIRANGRSRSCPIAAAPSAAPSQLGEILDILAQAHTIPTESILSVLTATHPARPAGASVVFITTVLNKEIMGALEDLHRRGWPVTVVYTASERNPDMKSAVPVWHSPYRPNWMEQEAYIFNQCSHPADRSGPDGDDLALCRHAGDFSNERKRRAICRFLPHPDAACLLCLDHPLATAYSP